MTSPIKWWEEGPWGLIFSVYNRFNQHTGDLSMDVPEKLLALIKWGWGSPSWDKDAFTLSYEMPILKSI
jgi:hypothetical protein